MKVDSPPTARFRGAHGDILAHIAVLRDLASPAEPRDKEGAAKAKALIDFYRSAVIEHHAQEEQELFREMTMASKPGDERGLVESIIARLTSEHRSMEAKWAALEPELKKLAKGKPATLSPAAAEALVTAYEQHAQFEETVMLPLAEKMLCDGDMAALDMALRLRHRFDKINAYL